MNVASLELCKELYELSGWKNSKPQVFDIEKAWRPTPLTSGGNYRLINIGPNTPEDIPAYDLGYLLRKLPPHFHTGDARGAFEFFLKTTGQEWFAGYNKPEMGKWLYDSNHHGVWERPCNADTPEDALCKLAIELFKQGILHKEPNAHE